MADFNTQVIEEFRSHGGQVGGPMADMPLLLLHHKGARSGQERVSPLAYLEDNGRYAIFASKAGAPTHPAWYHNLLASPQTEIEVGTATARVLVTEATGDERDRLFAEQVRRTPTFGGYQEKAGARVIPILILTPTGDDET